MGYQPLYSYENELLDPAHSRIHSDDDFGLASRGKFQEKVYFYLTELRALHSQASPEVQLGISDDLITRLAHILAEGQIFDVVAELAESQRLEEQILHKELVNLRSDQSAAGLSLLRKHQDEIVLNTSSRPHHLPVLRKEHDRELQNLNKRHNEALRKLTSRILDALDGRVLEQQTALEHLGVPGFIRTTNSNFIRIQMRILDWILRLPRHK